MNLAERLREYIQACFTGLWIESHEHEDALAEIAQLCRDEDWQLATWDIDAGLGVLMLELVHQHALGISDPNGHAGPVPR